MLKGIDETDVQLKNEIQRKYDIEKIYKMTKEERDKLVYNIKNDTKASILQLNKL